MPRGVVPKVDRMLSAVKACDKLIIKRTQGKEPPTIVFYDHFTLMYVKKEKIGWVIQGYRCRHCDKIAATTKELATLHLHICTTLAKAPRLKRTIFNLEKTD
jgi:hypothetical protein